MILTEQSVTNLYRVRSPLGRQQGIFVENSELEWTDKSGKQVTLNRGLATCRRLPSVAPAISSDDLTPWRTRRNW